MRVQTLLKVFFLTFFLAIAARQADASHLYGSEFTYEYLGQLGSQATPFRYKMVYKIYNGNLSAGSAVSFSVYTKDGIRRHGPTTIAPNSTAGPLPLPIPPGCTVAGLPNIWLWTYERIVDLP